MPCGTSVKNKGIYSTGSEIVIHVLEKESNYTFIIRFANEGLTHYTIDGLDDDEMSFLNPKLTSKIEEELYQYALDEICYWCSDL